MFQTQMFLRLTIQRERDDRFRRYDIVLEAGPLETPPMLSPLGGQGGTNGWETNRRSLSSISILVLRPILRDDLRYRLVGTAQRNLHLNLTGQGYRALEKRRKLMDAWSAYCEPKTSANIVQRIFLGKTVN